MDPSWHCFRFFCWNLGEQVTIQYSIQKSHGASSHHWPLLKSLWNSLEPKGEMVERFFVESVWWWKNGDSSGNGVQGKHIYIYYLHYILYMLDISVCVFHFKHSSWINSQVYHFDLDSSNPSFKQTHLWPSLLGVSFLCTSHQDSALSPEDGEYRQSPGAETGLGFLIFVFPEKKHPEDSHRTWKWWFGRWFPLPGVYSQAPC